MRLLQGQPAFSEFFLQHAASGLKRIWWTNFSIGKEGAPQAVVGQISQETLAEIVGTTRSRISFFMNQFRKLGFISYYGHLEIHTSLLNVVLHD